MARASANVRGVFVSEFRRELAFGARDELRAFLARGDEDVVFVSNFAASRIRLLFKPPHKPRVGADHDDARVF